LRHIRLIFTAVLFAFLGISTQVNATHLRAGEIIVKRVNCSGLTFEITIIVYTDSKTGNAKFGNGQLRFGDENEQDEFFLLPNQIPNNTHLFYNEDGTTRSETFNEDLGLDVAKVAFTIRHTYGSTGKFTISYVESNRNDGVLNIENGNSVNTRFYIETEINIDSFLGCNNTPVLLIPPIDRACPNVAFYHNPGAYDPDGDSIAFELVIPKKDVGAEVANYISPADQSFYENFNAGNETGDGPPDFKIDPITGEIEWNAPGKIGEYNIAFIVKEYRYKNGEWIQLGFVTRDMQIIVEDCDNERPELIIPEDICVEAGEVLNETIFGIDPDGDNVKIEAFSQILEDQGAVVTPDPAVFQSSVPQAQMQFTWNTECVDVRDQPYTVVFKITDNPPMGPKLVSFASWNITVVGPQPALNTVTQDGQGIRLNWDKYLCQNAEIIQIWRRVDSNPYDPDECETGIRENAGYNLIQVLSPDAATYRDTNLAAAAKYCYRILAIFPAIPGGESIISDELCFEFVPAEEPVITYVSVKETDRNAGEIIVAWREPFELGNLQFPLDYKIHRAEGFSGGSFTEIGTVTSALTDSIGFLDAGLDTENKAYHYKISVVDPTGTGGDEIFSAEASSVRLLPTPQFGQIRLDWNAFVPWSNTIALPPGSRHQIYRGDNGQSQDEFILLAEVDVTQFGFSYIDSVNLDDSKIYCYRIQTKGTYGNPAIKSPQLNFSQIVCAQPSDSIPPCAPIVTIQGSSCEDFLNTSTCDFNDYKNNISWTTEFVGSCQDDIKEYEVYYAPTTDAEFTRIAAVTDTTYLHDNLQSFKGCYKVRAIDRSGNESEFSNEFCVDNCPYYELPNVFTPDNGDNCNNVFSAYSNRSTVGEDGSGGCGGVDISKCARFVKSVNFIVYNRWGKEVYNYVGKKSGEQDIYIDWDGTSNNGSELAAGVYYYVAEVNFDVVDPSNAMQKIKGWIHLLR
jgi:hypothetical protein